MDTGSFPQRVKGAPVVHNPSPLTSRHSAGHYTCLSSGPMAPRLDEPDSPNGTHIVELASAATHPMRFIKISSRDHTSQALHNSLWPSLLSQLPVIATVELQPPPSRWLDVTLAFPPSRLLAIVFFKRSIILCEYCQPPSPVDTPTPTHINPTARAPCHVNDTVTILL